MSNRTTRAALAACALAVTLAGCEAKSTSAPTTTPPAADKAKDATAAPKPSTPEQPQTPPPAGNEKR